MKIIIHSMAELLELTALIRGGTSTTKVGEIEHTIKVDVSDFDAVKLAQEINDHCGTLRGEYEFEQACNRGLPTDIPAPLAASDKLPLEPDAEGSDPTLDADGAPYSADWHSSPAKINADGRWKARRGRDNDAYSAWLLSLAVEVAEAAVAADAEPVATETHALPQDEDSRDVGADYAGEGGKPQDEPESPTVDLQALVAASFDQAASQSTDVRELLNAAQAFTTAHGHAKFNELKSAVAPIDGNPFGKALQLFTPEERQLMMACLANYPTHKEA